MGALRSEHISKRLNLAMLVIVASLLMLALPLIMNSYQSYLKNARALVEIQSLKLAAELANQISAERGPANSAMSSQPQQALAYVHALNAKRAQVDQQYAQTLKALEQRGFDQAALYLEKVSYPALLAGRHQVDAYLQLPFAQRSADQMDVAIGAMFKAWDENYAVMQKIISHSHSKNTQVSDYYTLILLLADLRDQAGRSASNIIASVAFNVPIPADNYARSLQTQRQSHYLWSLVNTIQPADAKSAAFIRLHQRVKTEFLDQGLVLVDVLTNDSQLRRPYTFSSIELTQKIVGKFNTVVELQRAILEESLTQAEQQLVQARRELLYTLLAAVLCLATVMLTMIYAKKWVFLPLIRARHMLLQLASSHGGAGNAQPFQQRGSLFDAIQHLQSKLQERDVLEMRLKTLANTDALTGVSNRFALTEYVSLLEQQPQGMQQCCIMLFDIDHFKSVNDQYGHIVGDQIICLVADQMKTKVRASDLLARYGGDEFLILLERVSLAQALRIADKIRMAVEDSCIVHEALEAPLKVTVSVGAAVGADSWTALLSQADEALFRAKAKGRNTVSG